MNNNEDFNIEKEIQEIKQILAEQKQEKLFGKYHDLFLLVLGFVFTTIAGGAISYMYQLKLNEYNKEQIDYKNQKEAEIELFKNLSEIITERQLTSSRLMHRISTKQGKQEIDEYYNIYLESTSKWSRYHALASSNLKYEYDSTTLHYFNSIKDGFVNNMHPCITKFKQFPDSTFYYERFQVFDSVQKVNIEKFYDKLSEKVYKK